MAAPINSRNFFISVQLCFQRENVVHFMANTRMHYFEKRTTSTCSTNQHTENAWSQGPNLTTKTGRDGVHQYRLENLNLKVFDKSDMQIELENNTDGPAALPEQLQRSHFSISQSETRKVRCPEIARSSELLIGSRKLSSNLQTKLIYLLKASLPNQILWIFN